MKITIIVSPVQGLDSPSSNSRDLIQQLHEQRDQKVLQLQFDPQCVLRCFFSTFVRLNVCTLAEIIRHTEGHVRMYLDFDQADEDLAIHDFVIKEGGYKHECLAISCLEMILGIEFSSQQRSVRSLIVGRGR
jgi:hypothetical protein